mmetsp:Transcript_26999/g.69598  ORF Transcript_26999/g.69598 Transcript_26999/m.69598 type:complete len:212 (-) Transcript_26999:1669-2304(-)
MHATCPQRLHGLHARRLPRLAPLRAHASALGLPLHWPPGQLAGPACQHRVPLSPPATLAPSQMLRQRRPLQPALALVPVASLVHAPLPQLAALARALQPGAVAAHTPPPLLAAPAAVGLLQRPQPVLPAICPRAPWLLAPAPALLPLAHALLGAVHPGPSKRSPCPCAPQAHLAASACARHAPRPSRAARFPRPPRPQLLRARQQTWPRAR